MLAGCWMMYVAALVLATAEVVFEEPNRPLCQVEICFTTLGVQLIYSTLFMRLLSLHQIWGKSMEWFGLIKVWLYWVSHLYQLQSFYFLPLTPTYSVPVCTRSMHGQLHFWIAVVPVHCGVTIVAIQASLTSKVKIDTLKSKPLYLVPIFSYLQ